MSQNFNYKHLYYFWVVAKEGGIARASERLGMAMQTISSQVRLLEQDLGVSLLKPQGRGLTLTEAGVAALAEAEHIFSLGENLSLKVRQANTSHLLRLRVGITDGLDKLAVQHVLSPALQHSSLRLLCHEGEYDDLLADLALHKLDLVLSDRPPPVHPQLKLRSQLLKSFNLAWFASPELAKKCLSDFPKSMSELPILLPTHHAAVRTALDHWFEREKIIPNIMGEFEDSALLTTFGTAGWGIFPGPVELLNEFNRNQLSVIAPCLDVQENFYAIYAAKKILHPSLSVIFSANSQAS